MSDSLLSVRSLTARYGAAQILFGIDLDLRAGEVVALMGRNGAGKSTTLKAIMGLLDQRSGDITFRDADISHLRPYEIARLGLGFVPEDRRVFSDLTVLENLEVGRRPARKNADGRLVDPWTPERLFELFPNLAEARRRAAGRMSGGEQQMLTVARTLMGNPYAILLDEPSEGVAPVIVDAMADMILALRSSGVAILLSEQNLPFASLVAARAYILERGEIRYSGSIDELRGNEEIRRAYLEV
ncbi:MAG: ABC transporter ATP-binding protein [Hyphomicrobiales bacterium]|nr:ABC transporter ATP-binding protein [Hyphomicrobiales bacterium]